jgi:tetratricopeptide (TPR) repeat protein
LLVTYRPGYRPPWMERSYASQLTLPALSPEDSRIVIGSVMDRLSTELTDTLLGKAEGNPFYLEELARAFRDQTEASNAAVPDTIQGLILARIDRLPEDAKWLLQTASVLGRQVSRRLLTAVWDEPALLDEQLNTLTRLEFLTELPDTDEPAYTFRHVLTQEVAYQSLVTPRRRAVHAAAGRVLEDLYPEGTHDGLLAHHFHAAGDLERALRYHRGAAEAARRVYAGREAVEHYTGALEVARLLGDAGDRDVRRGLHLQRGRVYAETGDARRARADFEAALTEARVAGDSIVAMQALSELGFLLAGAANYEEGLRSLRDAYQLAEQLANRKEQVAILSRLSIVRTNLLQLAEAVEHAHQARGLARELADERALALALDSLLIASVLLGDLQAADETGAQLVALHRSRGDLWYLQFALHLWSYCAKGAGRWDDATARLDEALSINRQIGDRGNEPLHLAEACWIQRSRGDYGHALATGTRAVTLATELEHHEWVAWSETTLGWTLCDIGAIGQAADHLERGLAAAQQAGSAFHQLNLTAQLAEVLFRTGVVERARTLADETEALLSRATLPPGMAVVESFRAYAALAAVRGGTGGEAQAERLLTSLLVAARGAAWHEAIATAALGLSRYRAAGGDAVAAEHACREALEAARRGGLPGLAWLAHAAFAALDDARRATERAQRHRREAMSIVDTLAASLTDASLREEFRRGARSWIETG